MNTWRPQRARQQVLRTTFVLLCASLLLGVAGLMTGSTGLEWDWRWADPIVQDIRLPRTLGAWLAGALLGLSGAVAQGVFRNPLADPYLLGSASGASLGVAGLLSVGVSSGLFVSGSADVSHGWNWRLGVTGAAFVGAWAAVLLTLVLARGVQQTLRLLLAGVVVGVVLGALTSLLMTLVPQALPAMQSFLLGSSAALTLPACALMAVIAGVCLLMAVSMSAVLDGLSLGEATARSLGLHIGPLRMMLVAVMALATATAVAQVGLIAFVGLVAPHMVRARVQATHAPILVLSCVMGGVLLSAADVLARGLWAPQELPVGVLTAVLGGGYLLWRMQATRLSGEA